VIAAGIGMVLLDQGAISRLDFGRTGGGRTPKDAIGIGGGDGRPPETTTIKKSRLADQRRSAICSTARRTAPST